jgi:hypothetical protein
VVSIAAALQLGGCAASGVQVSQTAATQFVEGKTTETEILQKLGRPTSVMIQSGVKTITYTGAIPNEGGAFIPIVGAFAGGSDYSVISASFVIDEKGILKTASYSNSSGSTGLGAGPVEMKPEAPRAVK